MSTLARKAPFPWFGGKSTVAEEVWNRFGSPKQYIEPFCGSAAILLAAPRAASLEVIGDVNCYVANFWRALKLQPQAVDEWQDYPVSHIDLYARHRWLTEPARVAELREALVDPEWPGDAKIAGWWLWGQCAWIGSGWCDVSQPESDALGKIPHVGDAGRGVHRESLGKIPLVGNAGRGVHRSTLGQIPFIGHAGMGTQGNASSAATEWLHALSERLARVRVIHGDWSRCLNHHYGDTDTAVFLDPPYLSFEKLYSNGSTPVATAVADWARENAELRIALCGHRGDYDMPGWTVYDWSRGRLSYGGSATTDAECIWFSPACLEPSKQVDLFGGAA